MNGRLSKQFLGRLGEDLASKYLKKKGYTILHRNFKARYGELDIVALQIPKRSVIPNLFRDPQTISKDSILVFVEVKTRVGRAYGTPEEAVTPWKLREVVKTAEYYKVLHPDLPEQMRVDVIGIEMDEAGTIMYFNHLESVTE